MNGLPEFTRNYGGLNEKWDRFFLGMAKYVSTASKDPSTKCGAVIANDDRLVIGMGYNGFPRGVEDNPDTYLNRELKYKMVVHAELNAILQAGTLARCCTLYVYPSFNMPPICNECAKAAIQSGIIRIVGYTPDENHERNKRWEDSISISKRMFIDAGVVWKGYKET